MQTLRRTTYVFVTTAVGAIAPATHAQPRFEAGGFAGSTSTSMHQSIDCGPVGPTDAL